MSGASSRQRGVSLTELLVSLAISSMLLLGVFASAQQFRQAAQAAENLHKLEEKARFVLDLLRADIRSAGYWGLHADSAAIRLGAGATVRCGGADATDWALRLDHYVAAGNDEWSLPCPPYQNRRQPGADLLEIRRADLSTSGADGRKLQVLSSRREAVVFAASTPPTLEGRTELRNLVVHAWYVSARSSHDSGTPSLRRKTLIRGKLLRDEEILSGVEDLQVRLAVDTDGDGLADRVMNPGSPGRVVAVRFWVLLRSDATEPGYQDARNYAYADRAARRFSDARRRLLVSGSEVVANAREAAKSERGVVLAAVLMVIAALSLMAVTGKGDAALQWLQIRNSREYAEAVQLAHTGIGMALAGDRFNIATAQTGRYCRIASRCVEWTVRHVETTPVPAGLDKRPEPRRALHFEVSAEGRAGTRARAPIVVGFVLITSGAMDDPLPGAIEVCAKEDSCPHDSAGPPIRRYWREEAT